MLQDIKVVRDTDNRPQIIWEGMFKTSGYYRVVLGKNNKFIIEIKGDPDAMGIASWHKNITDTMKMEILSAVLFEAVNKLGFK